MRLSDKLKMQKHDLLERLKALSEKAGDEGRELDANEAAAWDTGLKEVRDLDGRIQREEQAEQMRREQPQRHAIDTEGNRHLILTKDMKLADRYPARGGVLVDQALIAKMVVGMATGDFPRELRDMGETIPGAGGYTVPTPLAAQWLDLMRSQTVCMELGAGTIDMTSQTLKIASIVTDVSAHFRPENTAIPTSDVGFGQVQLRARTVAALTYASLELIADSPNAGDMITTSLTQALALAADAAMLSGDGLVDATHDDPLGILADPNVNAIAVGAAPTNVDHWLDGMEQIEAANMVPDGVVFNPANWNEVRKLKNTLGDAVTLAADFNALPRMNTTALPAGNSIIADWDNSCLFGLRAGIQIEATRLSDTAMSKGQVAIRAIARLDAVRTRPKGVTKLTGIALSSASARAPAARK